MGSFYQQVLAILTTPPGNLAYHLVLAFSIAGALGGAFVRWQEGFPPARRMAFGLFVLLLAQLAQGVYAGLAQFYLAPEGLLPTLDRAISAFSLVFIVWLWAFPTPLRPADAATALLSLLVLTLAAFSVVWWVGQEPGGSFNGSLIDRAWSGFALALIAIGSLMLLTRRPEGFGTGLATLGLLLLGHVAHLLAPLPDSDFPGSVRLAQMAAYPLLLILPLSVHSRLPMLPASLPEHPNLPADTGSVLQILLASLADGRWPELCRALVWSVSRAMPAEACLLLSLDETQGEISIQCGWIRDRDELLEVNSLPAGSLPELAGALRHSRALKLPAGEPSTDLSSLAEALDLPVAGSLLAAPLSRPGVTPGMGLVLLAPGSTEWAPADQERLEGIARDMAAFIEQWARGASLETQLEEARQALNEARAAGEKDQSSQTALLERLDRLQKEAAHERGRAESLAALVASQEAAQETIARLQAENERLARAAASTSLRASPKDGQVLQGELRLALQEIARLREQLARASATDGPGSAAVSQEEPSRTDPGEDLSDLAQELRQPLASILGYTDLLLGESVGILGALQRKFLERIQAAGERAAGQLDLLVRTAQKIQTTRDPAGRATDLGALFAAVVAQMGPQLRARDFQLHIDLPEDLPPAAIDRENLQQALIQLLELAAGSTAPGLQDARAVTMRARLQRAEREYLLIQAGAVGIDEPGIKPWLSDAEGTGSLQVEGPEDGLSRLRRLVESQGGRIWSGRAADGGPIYSLLLPVSELPPPTSSQPGSGA